MKNTTKLEQLQVDTNKIGFIKSYPILNQLDITPKQKELIELFSISHEKQQAFINSVFALIVFGMTFNQYPNYECKMHYTIYQLNIWKHSFPI